MKILFGLLLCFVLLVSVSAKDTDSGKIISAEEFDSILTKGIMLAMSKPYRKISTGQTRTNDLTPLITTTKSLVEVANGNSHLMGEFHSPTVDKSFETFNLQGKRYRRDNNGAWNNASNYTLADRDKWNEKLGDAAPKQVLRPKIISQQKDCKFYGETTINGKTALIYGYDEQTKLFNESKNTEINTTVNARFWFDKDGALLKDEQKIENRTGAKITYAEVTEVYQFGAEIKIEIPSEVQAPMNNK